MDLPSGQLLIEGLQATGALNLVRTSPAPQMSSGAWNWGDKIGSS